jgi:signal peptidase I
MFTGLAHYWRFDVPGRLELSGLPPEIARRCRTSDELRTVAAGRTLLGILRTPTMDRRCRRELDADGYAAVQQHLGALGEGVASSSEEDVGRECSVLEGLAAPVLAVRRNREMAGTLIAVAATASAIAGLRSTFVETYTIAMGSMLPTLEPGDVVLGDRLWRRHGSVPVPRRGDIIVFPSQSVRSAWPMGTPDLLIKRVIGLPGDTVEVRLDDAFINGWKVPTCDVGAYTYVLPGGDGTFVRARLNIEYLEDRVYLSLRPRMAMPTDAYVVKAGEVYVLGDNRDNSFDSRAWAGGVPLRAIASPVRRFLSGSHRDGSVDLSRFLRSIDSIDVPMEGMDVQPLRQGLQRCLRERPKDTVPPGPGVAAPPESRR